MKASIASENDFFETSPYRLVTPLEPVRNIAVEINGHPGSLGSARLSHFHLPFNNVEVRRASVMAMNTADILASAVADPDHRPICYSFYPCGFPPATQAGSQILWFG